MIVLLDSICEFLFAYLYIHVHQVPLEMWYSLRKILLIYLCLVFIHLFILFFSNSISSFNNRPLLKRKTEYFDGRLLCSCVNSPQSFLDNQSHQHNEPNLIQTHVLKKNADFRWSLTTSPRQYWENVGFALSNEHLCGFSGWHSGAYWTTNSYISK